MERVSSNGGLRTEKDATSLEVGLNGGLDSYENYNGGKNEQGQERGSEGELSLGEYALN